MKESRIQTVLSGSIYVLTGLIGAVAFLYPFLVPAYQSTSSDPLLGRVVDAPVLTLILLVICLAVLFVEIQGQAISAKMVASLGLLVAATATLRFVEVAIPGPGGFSPIFVPIILVGYVFGARFGFLMGTLTMLVSAILTGGIGPWLPYQMFVAGWLGLFSGWLPHPEKSRSELLMLVGVGVAFGILFGLIMNIYFWPFLSGVGNMGYESGEGPSRVVESYLIFYLSTSFFWDLARAIGNGVLIAFLGLPVIRALNRFRDRFRFQVVPS